MERTIKGFIEKHGIRISSERTYHNPNMDDFQGDHWKVKLSAKGKSFTIYFSKGYGHHGQEPDAAEVLECMTSDITCVHPDYCRDFEDFCSNLGYDSDSRTAERIYKNCVKQTEKFTAWFDKISDTAMDELLSIEF